MGRLCSHPSDYEVMSYDPLIQSHFGKAAQKVPFELVNIPKALATKTVPDKVGGACIVWIEVVTTRVNRDKSHFRSFSTVGESLNGVNGPRLVSVRHTSITVGVKRGF